MNKTSLACLTTLALLGHSGAFAQQSPRPDSNQVIVPEVERREVKLPKFPSKDIAVGLFAGTYATQNFGSTKMPPGSTWRKASSLTLLCPSVASTNQSSVMW